MLKTDGRPTVAWAGASTKDRDSKRRWIARRRTARLEALKTAARARRGS